MSLQVLNSTSSHSDPEELCRSRSAEAKTLTLFSAIQGQHQHEHQIKVTQLLLNGPPTFVQKKLRVHSLQLHRTWGRFGVPYEPESAAQPDVQGIASPYFGAGFRWWRL